MDGRRGRLGTWPAAIVSSALALLFLPDIWAPIGCGLEPWAWAVNAWQAGLLPQSHVYYYNYGPLGALLVPEPVGRNLEWAVAFHLALAALIGAQLFRGLHAADRREALAAAGLIAAGSAFPGLHDYAWLFTVGLWCAHACEWPDDATPGATRAAVAAAVVAAALAALLGFVKPSLGIGSLALTGAAALAGLLHGRAGRVRAAGAAAAFVATFAALGAFCFASAGETLHWLRGSLEISSGYSAAYSMINGGPRPAIAALSLLLLPLLALLLWRRGERSLAVLCGVLLPLPLLAFKHSFVRDDHALIFCTVLPWTFALVLLSARSRRAGSLSAALGVVALVFATSAAFAGGVPAFDGRGAVASFFSRPLSNLSRTIQFQRTRDELLARSAECLPKLRYPDELAAARSGTIDLLDSDLERIPANGLRWSPPPMIEPRGTVTPWLDGELANHLASDAPEHLVVQLGEIDGRRLLLDAPRAFRVVRALYKPVAAERDGPRILLERGGDPARAATLEDESHRHELSRQTLSTGARLEVPAVANELALVLRPTLRGRLVRLLYRWPAVFARLEYEDGQEAWARLVTDQLAAGLPLADLPRDRDGLYAWLDHRPVPRVRALRLSGPGLVYFAPSLEAVWSVRDSPPPAMPSR